MLPFKPPFLTADKLIGWDEIDGEDDDGRQADRREVGGSEDTTREDTSREDTTREDTAREDTAREAGRRKDSEGGRLGEDTAREDLQAEVGPNKDDESDEGGDLYSQVSFYFLLILHTVLLVKLIDFFTWCSSKPVKMVSIWDKQLKSLENFP